MGGLFRLLFIFCSHTLMKCVWISDSVTLKTANCSLNQMTNKSYYFLHLAIIRILMEAAVDKLSVRLLLTRDRTLVNNFFPDASLCSFNLSKLLSFILDYIFMNLFDPTDLTFCNMLIW